MLFIFVLFLSNKPFNSEVKIVLRIIFSTVPKTKVMLSHGQKIVNFNNDYFVIKSVTFKVKNVSWYQIFENKCIKHLITTLILT